MELLLTALTLLATVYALLPRDRRLDLSLKIRRLDCFVIVVGSLAIMYLEFYDFFLSHRWVIPRPWPAGINENNTPYLIFVAISVFVWFRIFTSRLTRKNIRKFGDLAEELLWSESYGELLALMRRHYKELFAIYKSDFVTSRWRTRLLRLRTGATDSETLRQFLESVDIPVSGHDPRTASSKRRNPALEHAKAAFLNSVAHLGNCLPDYEYSKQTAGEIIREVVLSQRFVSALAGTRPYFGIEILQEASKGREQFEFVDSYLTALILDSHSVLYAELSRNQNCSKYRYQLDLSNRLLNFLFDDVRVAEHFHVYKVLGDFAVKHLRELGRGHVSDPYNRAFDPSFPDSDAWATPLFPILRFFDIMVKEALYQGIEWHMWLYYLPLIVEGMVNNYDATVDPLVEPDREFSTRYSFVLYEGFSAMRDWAEAVIEIPRDQKNVILRSTRNDHENGNIPKSAVLALGESARFVLESPKIADGQKQSLVNLIFNLYFDFRETDGCGGYAETVLNSLKHGGPGFRTPSEHYWRALEGAFEAEESEFYVKREEKDIKDLEAMVRRGNVESEHD